MTDYTPDPSYDPNAPVVATYPQNSNILYTDPTTGALVFPTDIQTASGSLKPLSYASFNTVVLPSDDIRQYILFSASGTQFTLDYSNLLTALNNKYLTISSYISTDRILNLEGAVASYGYVNDTVVTFDPANNISIRVIGNALVVNYTNLLNNLALLAPINSPTFTGTVSGITAAMVGLGNVNNTSDANKPISNACLLYTSPSPRDS